MRSQQLRRARGSNGLLHRACAALALHSCAGLKPGTALPCGATCLTSPAPVLACRPRSDGIVKWVGKKTGPPTHVVDTEAKLAELEKENAVLVVGYFKEAKVCLYVAQ